MRWQGIVSAALGVVALASTASAETRYSGIVVAVARDGRSMTIEELGVGGAPVRRSFALGPSVRIYTARRTAPGESTQTAWPGGFAEQPVELRELHSGDFVTLSVDEGGDVARAIEVVRPQTEGFASPR